MYWLIVQRTFRILSIVLAVCLLLSCVSASFGTFAFADDAPASKQEYKISEYADVAAAKADGINVVGGSETTAYDIKLVSDDASAPGTQILKMGATSYFSGVITFPHKVDAAAYKPTAISGKIGLAACANRRGTAFWTGKTETETVDGDTTTNKVVYDAAGFKLTYVKQSDETYLPELRQQRHWLTVTTTTVADAEPTVNYTSNSAGDSDYKKTDAAAMAAIKIIFSLDLIFNYLPHLLFSIRC